MKGYSNLCFGSHSGVTKSEHSSRWQLETCTLFQVLLNTVLSPQSQTHLRSGVSTSVCVCVCVCVCVYKTRVCKAIWLSSLLHLLNLIKHPSNSLARLRTPITHTYVLIHSLPGSDLDLKDLQHFGIHLRTVGSEMQRVV